MKKMTATFLLAAFILTGCNKPNHDQWLGKWTGPEGTYLEIAGAAPDYKVTIHDLDAARTFDGVAEKAGIAFVRDDVRETITAGNGEDTGMKWLMDKKNCLVVKSGEGYCRD